MHHLCRMGMIFLALAFSTKNAEAGTVAYQQLPGPDSNSGLISSTLDTVGNLPGFHVADDFVAARASEITDVHWWGSPFPSGIAPLPPGGTDFQFIFYADNGGLPGAVLHTSGGSLSTATVSVGSGFDPVTSYSSDLSLPFVAASGATYWLSIFNQASDASWEWLSAEIAGNGSSQWVNTGSPCCTLAPNMAFELTLPEPATIGLLGFGLACLRLINRRRKAA
jgi:hypothetical protein